ncbi:unnamed protein product [Parascedosporium putredinis]|uniref:FAD dependent oxidoreductase domain-containing protein n=1 Tax=Parascedosporium putredinis TaxID=1442378 RepID=A0A9P1H023_9PEZI|nr:unnamed protein product [Parascedosporium putredinis]CAI7991356.1 unnamed protein product [Parascedosporium putredinis]
MTGLTLQDGQADLPSPTSTSSYWHRSPSQTLLGHRTTERLPETVDVVVIGSGITGAFAARELVERKGRQVLMLEAREVAWGATGRNGGHCQPFVYGSQPHVAAFELRNYAFLKQLVEDNQIPCDWVTTTGVHGLYTADLVEIARRNLQRLAELAPQLAAQVSLVTSDGEPSSRGAPSLRDLGLSGAKGAVVQRAAASLWPYRLVAWVIEGLIANYDSAAFNLQTCTPALDIQRFGSSWIVHTPRGQVAASAVLVACNGYVSRVLPDFTGLVVPVRGQVAALSPGSRVGPGALDHTYVFLAASQGPDRPAMDDYLVQADGGGRELVFGGGRMRGSDKGWAISRDDTLDPVVRTQVSCLRPLNGRVSWATLSTDCHGSAKSPRPSEGDGLWVCGGYTGHGMPAASLSAVAVVAMMCGAKSEDVDLPPEFHISEARIARARQSRAVGLEAPEELIALI